MMSRWRVQEITLRLFLFKTSHSCWAIEVEECAREHQRDGSADSPDATGAIFDRWASSNRPSPTVKIVVLYVAREGCATHRDESQPGYNFVSLYNDRFRV